VNEPAQLAVKTGGRLGDAFCYRSDRMQPLSPRCDDSAPQLPRDVDAVPKSGWHLFGASILLLILALPAAAQTITDGDTLEQGGVTYRLWGIDAPEAKQVCPDGWPAGSLAATRLQALTAGRSIVCQEKDRDRYGWIVAICRVSGEDLGAILVREGLAVAFVRYSADYVSQEAKAKADRLGVHVHDCQPAWEWRSDVFGPGLAPQPAVTRGRRARVQGFRTHRGKP
jgi:endonuclease YncB( thermonuclease family)